MKIPTIQEDPKLWDRIAKTKLAGLYYRLCTNNTCVMCGYKEKDGWVNKKPNQVVPFMELVPKFFFHMQSTHGIDHELLNDMVTTGDWV